MKCEPYANLCELPFFQPIFTVIFSSSTFGKSVLVYKFVCFYYSENNGGEINFVRQCCKSHQIRNFVKMNNQINRTMDYFYECRDVKVNTQSNTNKISFKFIPLSVKLKVYAE